MARRKPDVVPKTAKPGDLVVMRISRADPLVSQTPESRVAYDQGVRYVEIMAKITAMIFTEERVLVHVEAVKNWCGCCTYDRVTGVSSVGRGHGIERIDRYVGKVIAKEGPA
jgi:hypothetical protein